MSRARTEEEAVREGTLLWVYGDTIPGGRCCFPAAETVAEAVTWAVKKFRASGLLEIYNERADGYISFRGSVYVGGEK